MIQLILTYNSEVIVSLLNQILRSWDDSGIEKHFLNSLNAIQKYIIQVVQCACRAELGRYRFLLKEI